MEKLKEFGIVDVKDILLVSSDLGRARQTMDKIKEQIFQLLQSDQSLSQSHQEETNHATGIHLTSDFREWYMGDIQGKTDNELKATEPELYVAHRAQRQGNNKIRETVTFDLGETPDDHRKRTENGLKHLIQTSTQNEKRAAILVSHGGTIREMLKHHILPNDQSKFFVPNSSLTHFYLEEDKKCQKFGYKFEKRTFMCTKHLSEIGVL